MTTLFRFPSKSKTYPYQALLLPTSSSPSLNTQNPVGGPRPQNPLASFTLSRRYARILITAILGLAALLFFIPLDTRLSQWIRTHAQSTTYPPYPVPFDLPVPPAEDPKPPLYQRYKEYENLLPQNNENLPFPDGKHAKFIFFANHATGSGWGNIMQEMVLNAHLAFAAGRAFVIEDYTWNRDGPPYSDYNGKLIPSRIPLSALVSGPLAGQPFSQPQVSATHPRFVSRQYYNQVCPKPYIISSSVVRSTLPEQPTALQTLEAWVDKLKSIEDRCVEIEQGSFQLFDIWIIGSERLHDILPSLLSSPITQEFAWSPLIHHAFQRNVHHFTSDGDPETQQQSPSPTPSDPSPLPLLALHLRRGDFVEHCDHLYEWRSTYTGYNTLPELPDRFFVENPDVYGSMSEDEIRQGYRNKCLVDIDKVRTRVVKAVKDWREKQLEIERGNGSTEEDVESRLRQRLRKVYIMTNGDREWLKDLKAALQEDTKRSNAYASESTDADARSDHDYDFVWDWDEVSTSRDLDIGWEAKYVAQALDMYVGQRAEIFVGNGFSSLTANVVMLRTVHGVEPWKTRFW